MSGRLILVRHGQTEANVERRLDTRLPGARLTELGRTQAQTLGDLLAVRPPTALVSSQALRARETAGFVETASGIALQVREGLHEAQAGELEDRSDLESHKMFAKVFHTWHAGDLSARIPGGESGVDIIERYVPVVDSLRAEYIDGGAGGDVVVVSHGAAIRLVAAYLAGVPGAFAADRHLENTSTVELVPTAAGWQCVRWGLFDPPFDATPQRPWFEAEATGATDDPMG
ncbi:histidine phosphatase family protein [Prescottella agglutinans]|uniref:Broad specificity phosphatase PhoE n=1 Tax=Prescottella agglutinans TaxID=1644129 RepID=A0ABT6MD35_9NOCA|nr:histidine phosphatase family protein [Prescottella agglutinans]MDH6282228.1 broad specificity phosphatase PhoE [Prescottella agglutinans]